MAPRREDIEAVSRKWRTFFTEHLGYRVHVVTYASVNRFLLHLALSVQRSGGFLNVLGTESDAVAVPREYHLDLSIRGEHNFTFAYRGKENPELDYRRILFKRLYYMWTLVKAIPDDDVVVYVDGHDVLFQRPLDSLVESWQQLTAEHESSQEPVMFMGYPWCRNRFHGRQMDVAYPLEDGGHFLGAHACNTWRKHQARGTLPFLDTGGYMGRASAIRDLLHDAAGLARQRLDYICMTSMHAVGIRKPQQLRVDTEARLFYSILPRRPGGSLQNWTVELERPLCKEGYFDADGQPPAHSVTGETPAVLHFVGPAKWYYLNSCVKAFLQQVRHEMNSEHQSRRQHPTASVSSCRYGTGIECNLQDARCAEAVGSECVTFEGSIGYQDVDRGDVTTFPLSRDIVDF